MPSSLPKSWLTTDNDTLVVLSSDGGPITCARSGTARRIDSRSGWVFGAALQGTGSGRVTGGSTACSRNTLAGSKIESHKLYGRERLVRNEVNVLVGLLVKIDYSLPAE